MTIRRIETAIERCNTLLAALQAHAERLSLPWEPIFAPLWDGDESHLTGDVVAAAFVADADHHKDMPPYLPKVELMALVVAVAYCIEGIKSDDERHAWNVTMDAAKLEGFLSGYRTGEAGLPLVQAIKDQLMPMAERAAKFVNSQKKTLDKTKFYRAVIALFPPGNGTQAAANKKAVNHIFNMAPHVDDGIAPFYWRGNIPNVELMDREHDEPIKQKQMIGQIQVVRRRPETT